MTRADGTYRVVRLVLHIDCMLHGNAVAENNINEGGDMQNIGNGSKKQVFIERVSYEQSLSERTTVQPSKWH